MIFSKSGNVLVGDPAASILTVAYNQVSTVTHRSELVSRNAEMVIYTETRYASKTGLNKSHSSRNQPNTLNQLHQKNPHLPRTLPMFHLHVHYIISMFIYDQNYRFSLTNAHICLMIKAIYGLKHRWAVGLCIN